MLKWNSDTEITNGLFCIYDSLLFPRLVERGAEWTSSFELRPVALFSHIYMFHFWASSLTTWLKQKCLFPHPCPLCLPPAYYLQCHPVKRHIYAIDLWGWAVLGTIRLMSPMWLSMSVFSVVCRTNPVAQSTTMSRIGSVCAWNCHALWSRNTNI